MKRKLLSLLCIFLLSIMALHNIQEDKENTLTEIPIMCNTTSASDRQIESNDNLAANIEAISNTDSTRYSVYVAYPNENRYSYPLGCAVCYGPNGTVSQMTREEIREYPERIIGTVSEIPEYKTWGTGNVEVNGRIWIRIK